MIGAPDALSSVVIKTPHGFDTTDEDDEAAQHNQMRFRNEEAALALLGTLESAPALAPRLYGADRDAQLLILEDMGDGVSLADLLTGDDPDAAIDGLHAYARTLGRLHALTIGRENDYRVPRGDGTETRAWARTGVRGVEEIRRLVQTCRGLDVPVGADFEREMETVSNAIEDPGPFLAFNVSDACPDNHFITGDTVRLFDFEFAGFGHAFADAAYLRLPFPTCWCAARIPPDVQRVAEATYRGELIRGCPAATDDRLYENAMLLTCAFWTIRSVSWTLTRSLQEDEQWGLASHRRRHMFRLERLHEMTAASGRLTAIGQTAGRLAATLRNRWEADDLEMPLYPAFTAHPD